MPVGTGVFYLYFLYSPLKRSFCGVSLVSWRWWLIRGDPLLVKLRILNLKLATTFVDNVLHQSLKGRVSICSSLYTLC